jgi:excinuclease UvrABC nuclease subunit
MNQDDFKYLIKVSNLKAIKFETWIHDIKAMAINDAEKSLEIVTARNLNHLGGGIYRMYNASKEIIYVGKSNDIHRRLLQHVGKRSNTSYFFEEVQRIDFYRNDDPVMQTMLEGIFIAHHAPIYNDEVKDRMK